MPDIKILNNIGAEFNVEVNRGSRFALPAADANGNPGSYSVAFNLGMPEPGVLSYGNNLLLLSRDGFSGRIFLTVPQERLITPILYFNPGMNGFDWILFDSGRVLNSGSCLPD